MAVMASGAVSSLVCVLCVALVPLVWADYCQSYEGKYGVSYNVQNCGSTYCCGDCSKRYCCGDGTYRLTDDDQKRCSSTWSTSHKVSRTAIIIASIFGAVLPIVLCVSLICCVAPCCIFYKKCRKRHQGPTTVVTTTRPVSHPGQPAAPSGLQPAYPSQPSYPGQPTYPGYQPVPTFGTPMPSAPSPSYINNAPANIPAAFNDGQPMYPLHPPGQPQAPPPFNPSYGPPSS